MSSSSITSGTATIVAHCWLLPGGAREVLCDIVRQFPETTKIFTLLSREKFLMVDGKAYPIITTLPGRILQIFFFYETYRIPLLSWLFDYRNLMPFYPFLIKLMRRKMKKNGADTWVLSSFAIAKNVVAPGDTTTHKRTILYLHSPMQYIHSHHDEYSQKLSGIKSFLFGKVTGYLRKWDLRHRTYDIVHTNSKYTSKLAKEYYGLDASHVYPTIKQHYFSIAPSLGPYGYRVATGRLVTLVKEFDRIIELFNELRIPLLIMGSGPDEAMLKALAGPTITFLGRVQSDEEKSEIIKHAVGCINITKESFGLATAESLLCGVPVLGYAQGATVELVDKNSGILVENKDLESLREGYRTFVGRGFDRVKIQKRARELFEGEFSLKS